MVVVAQGRALQRLREAALDPAVVRDEGNGRFELRDIAWGIGRIHLHAHETLPFEIEFTPITGLSDFVVCVTQYYAVDGADKMVGGQTFVFGKVTGFPTR